MAAESFVYKIVALTVFVLIAATVLVPVVQDSQMSIAEYQNNLVSPRYTLVNSAIDVTAAYDHSTTELTLNGETYTWDVANDSNGFVLIADSVIIMAYSDGFVLWTDTVYLWQQTDWTLTISDGVYTASNSSETITGTGDVGYMLIESETGTYGCYSYEDRASIKISDSSKISIALCRAHYGVTAKSSFDTLDNLTFDCYPAQNNGIVGEKYVPYVSELTTSDAGRLAYSIESWSLQATEDSGAIANWSNTYIIAPIAYNVWTDNGGLFNLLDIIPLLVFVAAVLIAVALLRGKS